MICSRSALDPWSDWDSWPKWVTADELRRDVEGLAAESKHEAVPAYLLARHPSLARPREWSALCVASSVRDQIPDAELSEWTEQLAQASISLEILSGDGDPHRCIPGAAERARIDAWLKQQAAAIEAAKAEDQLAGREKAELDKQVEFEVRRGCGLRACWPGVTSAFRRGDIIYHPPPPDLSTQPGVAVVFDVEYDYGGSGHGGGGRVPARELAVLFWDVDRLAFTRQRWLYHHKTRGFTLMPPCCGRGAECPHLQSSGNDPQWPNGDPLDLASIRTIPQAFAVLLSKLLYQRPWQQRRKCEADFKVLLGKFYTDPSSSNEAVVQAEPLNEAYKEYESASHETAGSVGAESESDEMSRSDSEASEMVVNSDSEVSICEDGPDGRGTFLDSDDAWNPWSDAEDEPAVEADEPPGGYTFRIGPLGLDVM